MGKQTMGVPFHATNMRSETKAYHLHTPQSPIVRTKNYTRCAPLLGQGRAARSGG